MVISFSISDRETATPLDGVLVWEEYGEVSEIPFRDGRVNVVSSGAFAGARRSFSVWAVGYVPHFDYFFQHNGQSFDVGLSRYAGYTPEYIPEGPTGGSPLGMILLGLIVVGGFMIKK
jgi:hypothetical protein